MSREGRRLLLEHHIFAWTVLMTVSLLVRRYTEELSVLDCLQDAYLDGVCLGDAAC